MVNGWLPLSGKRPGTSSKSLIYGLKSLSLIRGQTWKFNACMSADPLSNVHILLYGTIENDKF